MRKTYKPLARVEKASQVYGRKTLNVNDCLDVKIDEDDIENIDEYWSTAASVIGNSTIESMDKEEDTEPSDTLFNINNIRKSIKTNMGEDLYKESITQSAIQEDDSISDPRESVQESVQESQQEALQESQQEVLQLRGVGDTNNNHRRAARIEKVYTQEDGSSLIKMSSDLPASETHNNNSEQISNGFSFDDDYFKENNEKGVTDNTFSSESEKGDTMLKTFGKTHTTAVKEKIEPLKMRKQVEGHVPGKTRDRSARQSFAIEEVKTISEKNRVFPVLCTDSFDVATMHLDYLAFVKNHRTENSFTIFVVKGKIEIKVNGKTKKASTKSVTVVEKGDVYSLNCVSTNGAVLLLTYAL